MNELVLPPSPNWYLSNILVCSRHGTIAWGAKNLIIIAKQKEGRPSLQYSVIKDCFKDKITALAFCSTLDSPDSSELLISGGDEDKVKVWNLDTLEVAMEFSFKDGKSVVGVDWSPKDNLAYAVNSEGCLMYCYMSYETYKVISLGKLTATCLASCPHDPHLIAIGVKSGLIYIIQKESILYKLRGHNEEIVSLSWCPSDVNVLNGSDKRDLLLASGAKDRSVFIWKAGGDGRYETMINLPNTPLPGSSHKGKAGAMSGTGTWIAVCWIEPKVLLTASLWGELLSWDLSTNKTKPTCKLFHTHHNRGLFCIAAVPKNDAVSDNWRTESEFTVWTLAQDRWIVCCKRNNDPTKLATLEYKIPTQGGFVYCIGACPIDTTRVAFGVGDSMLRLWNLSEPHTKTFDVVTHWQKIKGKIRAVSWLPNNESTVAFGTGEGRVGVFDSIGTNKPPILYRQYHRNTVYKLEWAKLGPDYHLFSCAEGELVAYKKSEPNNEPKSIIKEGCTEFAWKSNMCLAIALENGSIMFYDQELRNCNSSIHVLRSMVNCLAWHPESTTTDESKSSIANYLAVASDWNIIIFDMSELIKEMEMTSTENCIQKEGNNEERKLYKLVASLNGHVDKVVCLAWSPHVSGHLVSGSYDNIAQVWNVGKQELMGTYMCHDGPVLCCMWSPLKPQLIITGSSDFMLRIWDYTLPAQSPKQLSDLKNMKQKQKQQKMQKKWLKIKMDETQNNSTMSNGQPGIYHTKSEALIKKKEKNSYFREYNKIINDKSKILNFITNVIREVPEQKNGKKDIAKISLFSEKSDLLELINHEKITQDNSNAITEMNMWHDNLENNLICAAKDQELTDFLVSLAPSVSMKMWKEMCEAYAHQLIRQSNVEKAVSYLLCIHKIYEAIEAYIDANLFKEAYVLAKFKLDPDDAFLSKVLELWSEWCVTNGQFEQAAQCRVELKQFDKAAQILARRKDVHCLEIASELAFLSGDECYGISLIVDAVTRALLKSNWSKARSIIGDLRQIQYLNVHIDAHETIMSTYRKQTELESMRIWLEKKNSRGVLQTLEMKYNYSYYDVLCKNYTNTEYIKNETKDTVMQINASYRIAIAATCDEKETQLKLLATLLGNLFECEKIAVEHGTVTNESFFIHILAKLDVRKPMDEGSIYAKSNYPVSQSIRAYLCIGLLNWLIDYADQLSVEEETQCTILISDLLDDAINETTLSYQDKNCKLCEQEDKLLTLSLVLDDDVVNNDKYKKMKEEIEKLKLDRNIFKEERVCMPNPRIIFDKACSLIGKLSNANSKLLLHSLDKISKIKEIKPLFEQEENISKKFENLSLKWKNILKQNKIEI